MIKSASMTKYTREVMQGKKDPSVDMTNRKPRRTKEQKIEARASAIKADGRYMSGAPRMQGVSANTSR